MAEKNNDPQVFKVFKPKNFLCGLDEIKQDLIIRTRVGDTTYGIEILDECVDFIRPKTVTLIAACPNVGKSLLAQNIACNIAKQNKKVLFCSCEMSTGLLMERQLKQIMGITSKWLIEAYEKHPSTIDQMFDTILHDKQFEYLKNISILDIGGITIDELLEVFDKHKEYEFIIVDYIQRIKGNGSSEYEQIGDVSYKLQIYANDHDRGMIVCSQIPKSNENDNRNSKGIDFTKLKAKGAGNIEEDAHVAIKMAEDYGEMGERYVMINLSKNKYGSLKCVTYKYEIDQRLNFSLVQRDPQVVDKLKQEGKL